MESVHSPHEAVYHDKKIGVITNSEVIIYTNKLEQKINLKLINHVQLIKKRVYQLNAIYSLAGVVVFYFSYYFYFNEWIVSVILFLVGVVILFFSFYKKFYRYSIRIKDKNSWFHTINGTQGNKGNIKKFYYKLAKRVPKNN